MTTDITGEIEGRRATASNPLSIQGTVTSVVDQLDQSPVTKAVSVSTTAVRLDSTPLTDRKTIVINNNDLTIDLFIGGSGVTASDGQPIYPLSDKAFDLVEGAQIWGITSTGTVDVRVMELK